MYLLKNLQFFWLFGYIQNFFKKVVHAWYITAAAVTKTSAYRNKSVLLSYFWKHIRNMQAIGLERDWSFSALLHILRLKEPATKALFMDLSDGLSDNLSDE